MTRGDGPTPALAWKLADQIGQLNSQFLAVAEDELAGSSITPGELIALSILESFPEGLTQTAWGGYQGVSRQRAHVLTKRLVVARLIKVAKDGRRASIQLTRAGRSTIEACRPSMSRRLASEMAPLGAEDAKELSRLLQLLTGS